MACLGYSQSPTWQITEGTDDDTKPNEVKTKTTLCSVEVMSVLWGINLRAKEITQDIYAMEWHESMHCYINCCNF